MNIDSWRHLEFVIGTGFMSVVIGAVLLLGMSFDAQANDVGRISSVEYSKCLEVPILDTDATTVITGLHPCVERNAQNFSFQPVEANNFLIVAVNSGLCLAAGDKNKDGEAPLAVQSCDGTPKQQFRLNHFLLAEYAIVSSQADLCLTVSEENGNGRHLVSLKKCNAGSGQNFRIFAN